MAWSCLYGTVLSIGGIPQVNRLAIYDKIKNYEARILVSTDLLSRGVDFERVNIVINYDMPTDHHHSASTSTSSGKLTDSVVGNQSKKKPGDREKASILSESKTPLLASAEQSSPSNVANDNSSRSLSLMSASSLSTCADTYLHRVGRSGRFGTRGLAISFISSVDDGAILESIQSRFEVEIQSLPDTIETSSYSNSLISHSIFSHICCFSSAVSIFFSSAIYCNSPFLYGFCLQCNAICVL